MFDYMDYMDVFLLLLLYTATVNVNVAEIKERLGTVCPSLVSIV